MVNKNTGCATEYCFRLMGAIFQPLAVNICVYIDWHGVNEIVVLTIS